MASSSNPMGAKEGKKRKVNLKHTTSGTKKGNTQLVERRRAVPRKTPLPSTDVSRFSSQSEFQQFNRACSSREIVIERIFDETFLRIINFPWLARLKQWGWWEFMCQEVDVNPQLVKLFYFHGDNKIYDDDGIQELGVEKNDEFSTKVLGVEIKVEEDLIKQYIGGNVIEGDDAFIPENYPIVEKCQMIYNDPSICCLEKRTSKMDLCIRILHFMVCQVLFPRGGDFANASRRDIYWMGKIMDNDPPNLCALIIKRMLEVVELAKSHKNTHGLCYGKLVSKICRGLCSVDASELVDNRGEMAPLNVQTVLSMGWIFDEGTRKWVKKEERNQAQEEFTMGSMMTEIRGMFATMGERLDSMGNRLEHIEGRQQAIEDQVHHVNANVQALRNNVPFDLPYPFYHPPQP